MAYGTINAEQLTTQSGYTLGAGNASSFKNRIINGAMMIDQRNAGASFSPNTSGSLEYSVDRFAGARAGSGVAFSMQQVSDAPAGFVNSLKITVPTGATPTGTQLSIVAQAIEGLNVSDFGWGTANAQAATLSFWVKSSVTGTFPLVLVNSGNTRAFGATYTINSANTWEYKTVAITGDTTGTWLTTNGIGIQINWGLGGAGSSRTVTTGWQNTSSPGSSVGVIAGTVNLVATTGATFYITGVQLEVGTVATSFDYRSYGTELALCQRYCLVDSNESSPYRWFAQGYVTTSTAASFGRFFPVTMRTSPSVTASGAAVFVVDTNAGAINTTAVTDAGYSSTCSARIGATVSSGLTGGASVALGSNGTAALRTITYSAEL